MISKGKTVESSFNITLKDLKRDTVERILQEVVSREAARSSMQSKTADKDADDDDGDVGAESENDKLVRLQHDSKGAPRPLPVVDEDFSPDSIKAAMKKVPVSQKRGKK